MNKAATYYTSVSSNLYADIIGKKRRFIVHFTDRVYREGDKLVLHEDGTDNVVTKRIRCVFDDPDVMQENNVVVGI